MDEVWDGNFLRADLSETALDKPGGPLAIRQLKAAKLAMSLDDDNYKAPAIVRIAYRAGDFILCQYANRYPWLVIVVVNGRKKAKKCSTMYEAAKLHKKYKTKGYTCFIVSRVRGYDMPPSMRRKLPPGKKWCPRCAAPRPFKPVQPQETFYGMRKTWDSSLGRYAWTERRLRLLKCIVCGCTNRDAIFVRNNQPWEVKHYKPQRPQRTRRQTSHIKRRR